jgi:hypothetical protein
MAADLRQHRLRCRFIEPTTTTSDHRFSEPTKSLVLLSPIIVKTMSLPDGLHRSRAPASPCGHFITLALTMSQILTCVGIATPSLIEVDIHHADLLQHLGWHGGSSVTLLTCSVTSVRPGASPSLHQPTPGTSASLADELRHISWTGGFAFDHAASLPHEPDLGAQAIFLLLFTSLKSIK